MAHEHGQWNDLERLKHLDNPDREALMPHVPVLEALDLMEGLKVADVGAGLGYFTFPLAIQVRRSGQVIAVDPSPAAREELKRRIEAAKLHNVSVHDGTASATGIAAATLDRVLWHALFHEIPNLEEAIHETHRIVRRQGLFVVVDWKPGAAEIGPADHERWTPEDAGHRVTEGGKFRVRDTFEAGPVTWGIVFERI